MNATLETITINGVEYVQKSTVDYTSDLFLDEPDPIPFAWGEAEEDQQRWALAWFLDWRRKNPYILRKGEGSHFSNPVPDPALYHHFAPLMQDWAWAEAGGMNLEEMHQTLLRRNDARMAKIPFRKPTDFPAGMENTNGKQIERKNISSPRGNRRNVPAIPRGRKLGDHSGKPTLLDLDS